MAALRKDGIPVVPVCIECRHFADRLFPSCQSPNRPSTFDVVYGKSYNELRAIHARESNDLCGTAGNWYEPKGVPPKPTLWQRFNKWMDK